MYRRIQSTSFYSVNFFTFKSKSEKFSTQTNTNDTLRVKFKNNERKVILQEKFSKKHLPFICHLQLKILLLTALFFILIGTFVDSSKIDPTSPSSRSLVSRVEALKSKVYSDSSSTRSTDLANNCSTCSPIYRNAARERRIAEFKNELLTKLGLEAEPKVNMMKAPNLPSINDIIGTLGIYTGIGENNEDDEMTFEVSNDEGEDGAQEQVTDYEEFYVNTKRSITFAQKGKFYLKIAVPFNLKAAFSISIFYFFFFLFLFLYITSHTFPFFYEIHFHHLRLC